MDPGWDLDLGLGPTMDKPRGRQQVPKGEGGTIFLGVFLR